MNSPLVSIIIPVYNGSNYLREAIDSALAQTYKNCEIVVVNDGSTDETEDICLSYGDKLRYYKKENGGVASAVNLGIKKMNGEYFSWLAHDDIYYPNKTESQISALQKDGDMSKIVFGDFDVYYQDSGKRKLFTLNQRGDEKKLTHSVYPLVLSLIAGGALLINRKHFERAGVFDEALKYTQDYDCWFRILHRQETVYVNELMFSVRNHSMQDTQTKREPMKLEEIELWKMYTEKLYAEEMAFIYGSELKFLLDMRIRMLDYGHIETALDERIVNIIKKTSAGSIIRNTLKEYCKNPDIPIYIFGAGLFGRSYKWLLAKSGVEIRGFIDNDENKDGAIIDGTRCSSLNNFLETKTESVVIVAIRKYEEVLDQLKRQKLPYVITYREAVKDL